MYKTLTWELQLGRNSARIVSRTEAFHVIRRHLRSKSRTKLTLKLPH